MTFVRRKYNQRGFTLIEVMLVIAIIGVMATAIQFTFSSDSVEKKLEQSAERFAAVFQLASEYALLNNVELGLVITEQSYRFVGFDGVRWAEIPDQPLLAGSQVADYLQLRLQLDDLPVESALFPTEQMFVQDEPQQEDEPLIQPQIFILSGGDISPFMLFFELVDFEQTAAGFSVRVSGSYQLPLVIESLLDGEPIKEQG